MIAMDDFFRNWDPAERLLAAGALTLGPGVTGLIAMHAAEAVGEVTLMAALGSLGVVSAVAVAPTLLIAGAYALTASGKEGEGLLDAASETYQAVKATLRPVDWLEDKVSEYFEVSDLKTVLEIAREKAKDFPKDVAQELSERLLERSSAEKGSRSRDDPGGARSPSRLEGPMCRPGDPYDHGGDNESDGDDGGVENRMG